MHDEDDEWDQLFKISNVSIHRDDLMHPTPYICLICGFMGKSEHFLLGSFEPTTFPFIGRCPRCGLARIDRTIAS